MESQISNDNIENVDKQKKNYLEENKKNFINTIKYLKNDEIKYEVEDNQEDKIYEFNKNDDIYLYI